MGNHNGRELTMETITQGQQDFLFNEQALNGKEHKAQSGVHTYLVRYDDDTIALEYRRTPVLTFHRDGRVIARTGGWWTVTTKERMNRQRVANVRQIRGKWYVERCAFDEETDRYVPFVDGMDLSSV